MSAVSLCNLLALLTIPGFLAGFAGPKSPFLPSQIMVSSMQGPTQRLRLGPQAEEKPWQAKLESITVEFALGPSLLQAQLSDPKVLERLAQALRVIDQDEIAPEPTSPRVLGRVPILLLNQEEGGAQTLRIAGRNQLHHPDWGRLTLSPRYFEVIESWISEQEGSRVRLGVENASPGLRHERLAKFQSLTVRSWLRADLAGPEGDLAVHGLEPVAPFMRAYEPLYVPSSKATGQSWGRTIRLHTWVGDPITFELLDGSKAPIRPLRAALLRHPSLGLVWVSDRFRKQWLDVYEPPNPLAVGYNDKGEDLLPPAQVILSELRNSKSTSFTLRMTRPQTLGANRIRHVWPIDRVALNGEWLALWPSAKAQHLVGYQAVWDSRWQELRYSAPVLRWSGPGGDARQLVLGPDRTAWLAPGTQLTLSRDGIPGLISILEKNE